MMALYEALRSIQSEAILPLDLVEFQNLSERSAPSLPKKSIPGEASFGNSILRWASNLPPASLVSGLGALGSTVWFGLSYKNASSAPWQGIAGGGVSILVAGSFEAYENYSLYRQGKRSLSHSLLDGISDTLSAGAATYVGTSLSSLIISSVMGRTFPVRGTLGAGLLAAGIGFGVWQVLSAIKEGLLQDAKIS